MATRRATGGGQPTAQPVELQVQAAGQVKITNRDMIDFQKVAGVPLAKAFSGKQAAEDVDWLYVCALGWLVLRRQEPSITFDEVLDMDIDGASMLALADMVQVPTLPAESAG